MNEDKENFFKIDDKLINFALEYIKKQWKFFFGFFIGVIIIVGLLLMIQNVLKEKTYKMMIKSKRL